MKEIKKNNLIGEKTDEQIEQEAKILQEVKIKEIIAKLPHNNEPLLPKENNLIGEKTDEQKVIEKLINKQLLQDLAEPNYQKNLIDEIAAKLPYRANNKIFSDPEHTSVPVMGFLPEKTQFSPQNKNPADYLLEGLFNKILHDPDSVTFKVVKNAAGNQNISVTSKDPIQYLGPLEFKDNELSTEQNEYGKKGFDMQVNVIDIDVKDMDVSELFAKADLRNLTLDKTLMGKYADRYKSSSRKSTKVQDLDKKIAQEREKVNPDDNDKLKSLDDLKSLSDGEKLAIWTYTGNDYEKINGILRGTNSKFKRSNNSDESKNAFLDALVIQNLLTKLDNPFNSPTLRVEGQYNVQNLKDKALGNLLSENNTVVSTSEKAMHHFANPDQDKINLIFNSGRGLHVAPISQMDGEQEVLVAGGQFKITKAACIDEGSKGQRLVVAVDNMNVDTDERKERATRSGFDIKKHEYLLHIEPQEHKIERVEFKETTVIKKDSLLQDEGNNLCKHDIIKDPPKNNADLVKRIKSDPKLNTQIEQGLTRSNKILLKAITILPPLKVYKEAKALLGKIKNANPSEKEKSAQKANQVKVAQINLV